MRYETAVPIGRGASAEVFKARDPETGRTVALKLFPADSGDSAERRQREAEAQRRLSHPSICEIYDLGTTASGRGFIAMRFVDGEPLDQIAERLPLRQRVELVREIADAVGCAHQAGLVHRDLKPSNLLIEEDEDGALRPFVLDFGIVRVVNETRLTETGQVLGTPGYLSPEQARGITELDERSDVFSLGVVLYEVLTGELPFDAGTGVASLLRVLEHEPPLAHTVRQDVPPELAHIVEKAIEKDPKRRYADANALRRDLDRYLEAGEVTARGVSGFGRLLRRVERNPLPWMIGACLLLVALGSLGWAVRNRLVAERQTRDAEVFARRSADIESQWRFLQMLPEQSIADGRLRLRAEVDRLTADIERTNGRARAAGEFAVGRAEQALGRTDEALERFDEAARLGFDDPARDLAQGRALLDRTRRDLRQVEFVRDPTVRSAERQRLRQQLRESALPLLERATSVASTESHSRLMAQALAALLLDRFEHARSLAQQAAENAPWLFEADMIHADTFREEAAAARYADDHDAALEALGLEAVVLRDAIARAPSAPSLRERLCENLLTLAIVKIAGSGSFDSGLEAFSSASDACRSALAILPDSRHAAALEVEVAWRRALQVLRWQGAEAARPAAEAAVALAETRFDPELGDYLESWNLGNALFALGEVQRDLYQPSASTYERGAEILEAGLEQAQGMAFGWQSLGNLWSRHGSVLAARGDDPTESYGRAVHAFEQGMSGSEAQQSRLFNGLCVTRTGIAFHHLSYPEASSSIDIEAELSRAIEACKAALERDPEYLTALSNLGLAYWTECERQIRIDRSPLEAFELGRDLFRRLLELQPDYVSGRVNLAGMVAAVSAWSLDQPSVSEGELAALIDVILEARQAVEPIYEAFPIDVALNDSRLAILEAAAQCRFDRPLPSLDAIWSEARRAVDRVLEHIPSTKFDHYRQAEYHRRSADCDLSRNLPSRARRHVAEGKAAIDAALEVDPGSAELRSERDRLLALEAQLAEAGSI